MAHRLLMQLPLVSKSTMVQGTPESVRYIRLIKALRRRGHAGHTRGPGPPLLRGRQGTGARWGRGLAAAVVEEFAGEGAGGLTVFKGDLAVDEDPVVALGFLNPPPLAPGQIFGDFGG